MEAWGGITLTGVADNTGVLTQLYPTKCSAETADSASSPAASKSTIRKPTGGRVGNISIQTDGADAGTLEIWDISGWENGADVSSGTAITNAQKNTAVTNQRAQLLWSQNFAATPSAPAPWMLAFGFQFGLAARYIGAGTCNITVTAEGGYYKTTRP